VRPKQRAPGRKQQIQPEEGLEKQLGEVVREIREERDISQDRLAREMATDRTTISVIERGLRSPYVRTLVQIAAALNVKPSEFFRRLEVRMGDSWRTAQTHSRKRRVGG
jgi:transcriptional regulator with XRE-family HTH domain